MTIYGWYDDATQPMDMPSFDPPHDAPCPYCGNPISEDDVRTHSLMHVGGTRSYFYRTHRTCDEAAEDRNKMDGLVFDMIAAEGNLN